MARGRRPNIEQTDDAGRWVQRVEEDRAYRRQLIAEHADANRRQERRGRTRDANRGTHSQSSERLDAARADLQWLLRGIDADDLILLPLDDALVDDARRRGAPLDVDSLVDAILATSARMKRAFHPGSDSPDQMDA